MNNAYQNKRKVLSAVILQWCQVFLSVVIVIVFLVSGSALNALSSFDSAARLDN